MLNAFCKIKELSAREEIRVYNEEFQIINAILGEKEIKDNLFRTKIKLAKAETDSKL